MAVDRDTHTSGRSARRLRVMLIPALAAGLFGAVIPVVHADCAQPTVNPSGHRVRVHDPFTVRGEDWAEGCNDTTTCSIGCLGCSGGEPSPPARDIQLILQPADAAQDGVGVQLATGIDAGAESFAFEATVSIPAFVEPGRYIIYGEHRWRPAIDVYAVHRSSWFPGAGMPGEEAPGRPGARCCAHGRLR